MATKNETKKPQQEGTLSCTAMLELMRLPAEAKHHLAVMLMRGDLDEAEDRDRQLIDPLLELSLSVHRMRAVAESFAGDYIDTAAGITSAQAVAYNPDHYESLFNALFHMIVDLDKEAEDLHRKADQLFKDALARI